MALDGRALHHSSPDLPTLVALAREGLTLQAIGDRTGWSKQRVWRRLSAAGYRIAVLRGIRCAACGELLGKAELTTRSGRHYHNRPACDPAYERDARARKRRAVLALHNALAAAEARLTVERSGGRAAAVALPVAAWRRLRAAAQAVEAAP
jgi:hypothetical protein